MRILLVEDDLPLAEALTTLLHGAGYALDVTHDGLSAETLIGAERFDLVILDLNLPEKDGLAVLRSLRGRKNLVPILILTARGEPSEKVAGLDLGADDYMVKPFDVSEFEARVRSILRRQAGLHASDVQIGPVRFDMASRRFHVGDEPLDLPARELALLELFFLRRVVMTAQIDEFRPEQTDTAGIVLLYGADVGVDPAYRGRGLATALYAARQELVWRLGLKGQVTGGMLQGYGAVKHQMSIEDYYAGVVAGRLKDATLSMQLGVGFEPKALLKNYLNDPVSDNASALIVLDAAKDVAGASRELARKYVRLTTPVPGPRGAAMLARRAAALPAGLGKATDVCVERAHGALMVDVDGNVLIDMASGIGVTGVGNAPAEVVDAVTAQTQKFLHTCSLVTTYEPMVRLAEVLNEITPGAFAKKTIFANSGAEAVENAVKMARKATGRPAVICFEGGYHGRTLLTLTLTSKYGLFKQGFGPFAPDVVRLPIPSIYRTPAGMTEDQYLDFAIRQLEQAFVAQVDPSACAAVIIEPVQGEAGFIPVPPRFLQRIRELCTQHGIVLIADEVQCGMGRTGKVFASEHYGLVPDMLVSA